MSQLVWQKITDFHDAPGPTEDILNVKGSYTAKYLKKYLQLSTNLAQICTQSV